MGLSLRSWRGRHNRIGLPHRRQLRGELLGGAVGGLVAMPFILSSGGVIFSTTGPEHAATGSLSRLNAASLSGLVSRIHSPGETILRKDELGDSLFRLSRGWVGGQVGGARPAEGLRLSSHGPVTAFGQMPPLAGPPRSATVQAETTTLTHEPTRDAWTRMAAAASGIELPLIPSARRINLRAPHSPGGPPPRPLASCAGTPPA